MTAAVKYSDLLTEKGIRASPQRIAIIQYVYENRIHPTVDAVYSALSPDYPTLSRTTVYNTLHLFAEKKLVNVVTIEGDELRYDGELSPHFHFKCTRCGKLFDMPFDPKSEKVFSACSKLLPEGFSLEATELNMRGICPECGGKNNQ